MSKIKTSAEADAFDLTAGVMEDSQLKAFDEHMPNPVKDKRDYATDGEVEPAGYTAAGLASQMKKMLSEGWAPWDVEQHFLENGKSQEEIDKALNSIDASEFTGAKEGSKRIAAVGDQYQVDDEIWTMKSDQGEAGLDIYGRVEFTTQNGAKRIMSGEDFQSWLDEGKIVKISSKRTAALDREPKVGDEVVVDWDSSFKGQKGRIIEVNKGMNTIEMEDGSKLGFSSEELRFASMKRKADKYDDLASIIESKFGWSVAEQFKAITVGQQPMEDQNDNALRYILNFLKNRQEPEAQDVAGEIQEYFDDNGISSQASKRTASDDEDDIWNGDRVMNEAQPSLRGEVISGAGTGVLTIRLDTGETVERKADNWILEASKRTAGKLDIGSKFVDKLDDTGEEVEWTIIGFDNNGQTIKVKCLSGDHSGDTNEFDLNELKKHIDEGTIRMATSKRTAVATTAPEQFNSEDELMDHFGDVQRSGDTYTVRAIIDGRTDFLKYEQNGSVIRKTAATRWGKDKNGSSITLNSKVQIDENDDETGEPLEGTIDRIDSDGSLIINYTNGFRRGMGYGEHMPSEVTKIASKKVVGKIDRKAYEVEHADPEFKVGDRITYREDGETFNGEITSVYEESPGVYAYNVRFEDGDTNVFDEHQLRMAMKRVAYSNADTQPLFVAADAYLMETGTAEQLISAINSKISNLPTEWSKDLQNIGISADKAVELAEYLQGLEVSLEDNREASATKPVVAHLLKGAAVDTIPKIGDWVNVDETQPDNWWARKKNPFRITYVDLSNSDGNGPYFIGQRGVKHDTDDYAFYLSDIESFEENVATGSKRVAKGQGEAKISLLVDGESDDNGDIKFNSLDAAVDLKNVGDNDEARDVISRALSSAGFTSELGGWTLKNTSNINVGSAQQVKQVANLIVSKIDEYWDVFDIEEGMEGIYIYLVLAEDADLDDYRDVSKRTAAAGDPPHLYKEGDFVLYDNQFYVIKSVGDYYGVIEVSDQAKTDSISALILDDPNEAEKFDAQGVKEFLELHEEPGLFERWEEKASIHKGKFWRNGSVKTAAEMTDKSWSELSEQEQQYLESQGYNEQKWEAGRTEWNSMTQEQRDAYDGRKVSADVDHEKREMEHEKKLKEDLDDMNKIIDNMFEDDKKQITGGETRDNDERYRTDGGKWINVFDEVVNGPGIDNWQDFLAFLREVKGIEKEDLTDTDVKELKRLLRKWKNWDGGDY